jgi:hypothetical protein
MTLTMTLRRDDEAGFQRYLRDVYAPGSSTFRQFLTQPQLTRRFGPSSAAYEEVRAYLRTQGFQVVSGSRNHLTITVRGTRAQVESTFALHIRELEANGKRVFVNDADPAVPEALAPHLQAVVGLMSQPTPRPAQLGEAFAETFRILYLQLEAAADAAEWAYGPGGKMGAALAEYAARLDAAQKAIESWEATIAAVEAEMPLSVRLGTTKSQHRRLSPRPTLDAPSLGVGQKVGVLASSTFQIQDVANWLALAGLPAAMVNQVSKVDVAGGAPVGAGETDALLAVSVILNLAPGAQIAVYDAPLAANAASFQAVLNRMINDGVTVISNTNTYCEDQTTLADVQSLDSTLASAAASGITVLSATGDAGSACRDGSQNTIAVPTDSPHVTAVGGSSATAGSGNVYGSETWFDGTHGVPPTGAAGFGVSQFFSRPSYQTSLVSSSARSVPDVVAFANPTLGPSICQADAGGCPSGQFGGTSLSTPVWAAVVAGMNQRMGKNLGFLNPGLYAQGAASTFHPAASLNSDVAHVGLGSPNFTRLYFALSGTSAGAVSASASNVTASTTPLVYFDGGAQVNTPVSVSVLLEDGNGFYVSGKSVTLSASGGSATITPATAQTNADNGVAVFTVQDAIPETLTFTATDATDSIVIPQTITLQFQAPPAAAASIQANPPTVPADGVSTASVIVTLKDAQGNPTPGKHVLVQETPGAHAVLTGPASGVTDANGQIQFLATDLLNETVTFTAVDVSDSQVAVPGSATVTYSGSITTTCYAGVPPTPGDGYTLTPYITGQPSATNLYYGNVNFGCPGTNPPAFSNTGVVLVSDFLNGALYEVPRAGGTVSSSDLLATLPQTVGPLVFGKDGNVYAAVGATGSNFHTGEIIQVDPATGAQLRVLATGLTCPGSLSVDPLSGDLFFDDQCTGAGSDDPTIYRVVDPANTDPNNPMKIAPYATTQLTPNGGLAFAPNGTLYVVNAYYQNPNAPVMQISGTNSATVTVTPVSGITSDFGIAIGAVNSDGSAQSLIVEPAGTLSNVPIANPSAAVVLATGGPGVGTTGPDGCLYTASVNGIYRLANASGSCGFNPTNPAPTLTLSPTTVSPNPVQGGSQTLTAKLTNVSPVAGVPILFVIGGANGAVKLAATDANGNAVVSYTGYHAGTDRIFASYAPAGGSQLLSNTAKITWGTGQDTSYLTLNLSPKGGTVGKAVSVLGSLVDITSAPATVVSGQTVSFALGGATCTATTDSNGNATCALTPTRAGIDSLTAKFEGTPDLGPSSDAKGFLTAVPLAPPAPTTTTVTVQARSGGGAIDGRVLAVLGLLILWRALHTWARLRGVLGVLVLGFAMMTPRAQAAEPDYVKGLYLGVRAGEMPMHLDRGRLDRRLATDGFGDVNVAEQKSAPGGTLYLGYELRPFVSLELGYTRRNSQIATLTGAIPVGTLHSLLDDTARALSGYGSIYSFSVRGRWELLPRLSLTPRIGGYYWDTRVTATADGDEVSATHKGGGVTAGVGLAYRLWGGLELGIGADYFHGSQDNTAVLYGGSLEWRFGR